MPAGDLAISFKANFEPDFNEFFLTIMLLAFAGVEIIFGEIVIGFHLLPSSVNSFKSQWYSEPLQAEFGHWEVTLSLFEAEITLPQSIKHLWGQVKEKKTITQHRFGKETLSGKIGSFHEHLSHQRIKKTHT